MIKINHFRDLLFLLFIIYYAQGAVYPQGSILSQMVLLLIMVICGVFMVKTLLLRHSNTLFHKIWFFLLVINVAGFVFTGDYSRSHHFSMFKGILITSLSFFPFYYMSYKGILTSSDLIRFFLLLLPVTILQYYFNESQLLLERSLGGTEVVNNVAYAFVGLIPFTFLFKGRRLLSFVTIIIVMFFIIQSAKRGALISGAIGLVYFIYFQLQTLDKRRVLFNRLLIVFCIGGLGFLMYDFFQSNEYLIGRMQRLGEEGGSSGRDIIYANILSYWINSERFLNLVFGYGFAASLNLSGTGHYAHNDWLELISNFGLMGVSVYFLLFYSAIKFSLTSDFSKGKRILMQTIISIWFVTTLFSMFYSGTSGYTLSILLGFLIGSSDENIT